MAIFNSYVSLPEGSYLLVTFRHRFCWNPNSTSKSWILRCDFDGEKKLMQPVEETSINAEADVPNSHWLVDFHRGVSSETPEKQQVSMMIDGINQSPAQTYFLSILNFRDLPDITGL